MKKDLINITYWREAHLLPLMCTTDAFYVKYARKVRDRIRKADFEWKLSQDDMTEVALTLTYYFEDVVSGLGVWYAFIQEHKRLYGRFLPFYNVDEEQYFTDEVNEQDVLFLIWMIFQKRNGQVIVNPENPYMKQLAHEIFLLFDEDFEQMPINEELLNALKNPQIYQDFYNVKTLMVQVCCMSYLFYYFTTQHRERIADQVIQFLPQNSPVSALAYFTESVLGVEIPTGPLAQKPALWLSRMLASWGMEQEAKWMEQMQTKELQPYLVVTLDEEKVVLEDIQGQHYELLLKDMMEQDPKVLLQQKTFLGHLVQYRGQWFLNGGGNWLKDTEKFQKYKEEHLALEEQNKKIYKRVQKITEGLPVFFFADYKEMVSWMNKNFKRYVDMKAVKESADSHQDEKNLAVFVSQEKGIVVLPDAAEYIAHPDNPFYKPENATTGAVRLLFDMTYAAPETVETLVQHDLLPDAALHSDEGVEQGRKLLKDNLDFLLRMIRSDFNIVSD